jgi:hypothetical protein
MGVCSFTKIRLNWISAEQTVLAQPGETLYAFLSPLAKKGDTLVVKIPLRGGDYYLIENRQSIGFDRILPDSGILILIVDPKKLVGSGPARIMNADPDSPHFSHATFRLDQHDRNIFLDKKNDVTIIPLWSEEEKQGVLVTSAEKSTDALKAALTIEKLRQHYPEPRGKKEKILIEECIASFKRFDFKRSYQIAQQAF